MKFIIYIFIISSYIYAQSYTFLVNKYDKEIELESKIISEIANSVINDVVLFIPRITPIEKEIYSKKFILTKTCHEANFVFVKRKIEKNNLCLNENKIYFTNNYKKLLLNKTYVGAFFWSKSRPNIVFIEDRLKKKNILLPDSYKQFIEDI